MRSRTLGLIVGAALLGTGGCASLPSDGKGVSTYRQKLDTEVIAYVESVAAREGSRVFWVNPPRKKADDPSN